MKYQIKYLLLLHVLLVFYSISGVLSKYAAQAGFLSIEFVLLYAAVLLILGVYALGWQQILKHMSLTTAYSNRAITIIWGILWGLLFFSEPITVKKVIGALFIIVGVILYSHANLPESTES